MLFRVLALGVAAALAGWLHSRTALPFSDLRNVANVLAGVNATLLGFLVSAGALLYAVANTTLARNLQRTGHFNRLLADLFIDCAAFLAALVAAVIGLFIPEKIEGFTDGALMWHGVAVIVFFTFSSFALLLPVGHKLWLLLINLAPEDSKLE